MEKGCKRWPSDTVESCGQEVRSLGLQPSLVAVEGGV
jgi:hypothetical protein